MRSHKHCYGWKAINITYSECVCVYSLTHPACKAHAPYYIVICGLSGPTTLFYKRHEFRKKYIQGGAEPTDTFHMVIDNIWKQGKISETIYKYVQVCYLLLIHYKLILWTSGRWPPFISMHCCKRVWNLPYTRLRRSSSIAATSSTMACLSSWIVMIRLRNTRSFRNPPQEKSGTVGSGDRAGQAMSPKLRTQVTRCYTFQRSIATDHMKWRPLLYRSPSRQPWQALAPAQYSNLKCVSRLSDIL